MKVVFKIKNVRNLESFSREKGESNSQGNKKWVRDNILETAKETRNNGCVTAFENQCKGSL